MDKTPKFTLKINEILGNLKPSSKKCFQCKVDFEITEKDIEFFKKFQVPTPSMCPDCRRQIRLAFANYTTLFKRDCNASTHNEKMVSSIPPDTKFPVFDFDYYSSEGKYLIKKSDIDKNKFFF